MKSIIFNFCVFVLVLGGAMTCAVYDFDIDVFSLLIVIGVIVFAFAYDKFFGFTPSKFKINGKMTPEQIQEILDKQEEEEWPKPLVPFVRFSHKLKRWGIEHKLYSLDELFWGLVIMLLSAMAFFVLTLMDAIISDDLIGPIGGFILICFCTGFYVFIKGVGATITDFLLN